MICVRGTELIGDIYTYAFYICGSQSQEIETILANLVNLVFPKDTKISWVWWHMHGIPATLEAEAGESLEPGNQRFQ